ncbi:PQQ-binding-like beta-propeller repeat protein, partial [Streptomyces palmae]
RPSPAQIATALPPKHGTRPVWQLGSLATDISERECAAEQLTADSRTDTPVAPTRRGLIAKLAAGGAVLAGVSGTAAWWLARDDSPSRPKQADRPREKTPPPPPKPWDAKPLTPSQYRQGIAPPTLWGPQAGPGENPEAFPPALLHDLVVVQGSAEIAAYDVTDGGLKWRVDCNTMARYFALSDDLVVCLPLGSGGLMAVDRTTGKNRWPEGTLRTSESDVLLGQFIVTVDDTTVYFCAMSPSSGDHVIHLCAFDVPSRTVRWHVPTPVEGRTDPLIGAAGDGYLVVSGFDCAAAALDSRTGKTVWKLPKQGMGQYALLPAISEGVVYMGGSSLTARRLRDGKQIWSLPTDSEPGHTYGGWGPPTLDGDALYASDGTKISRRDKRDGRTDWTHDLKNDVTFVPPVVQGNSVWTVINTANRYSAAAVHRDTGKHAWTYSRGRTPFWSIAGAGNRVFVVDDGSLTALPVF